MWTLLAAVLGSYNPPRTDLSHFYRSTEEHRKRKGGGTRRKRISKVTQNSPELVGSLTFDLDRAQAILGSLLAEHDDQQPSVNPEVLVESISFYQAVFELKSWGIIENVSKSALHQNLKCNARLKELLIQEDFLNICDVSSILHDYEYR